jgi:hypothetical protein
MTKKQNATRQRKWQRKNKQRNTGAFNRIFEIMTIKGRSQLLTRLRKQFDNLTTTLNRTDISVKDEVEFERLRVRLCELMLLAECSDKAKTTNIDLSIKVKPGAPLPQNEAKATNEDSKLERLRQKMEAAEQRHINE